MLCLSPFVSVYNCVSLLAVFFLRCVCYLSAVSSSFAASAASSLVAASVETAPFVYKQRGFAWVVSFRI